MCDPALFQALKLFCEHRVVHSFTGEESLPIPRYCTEADKRSLVTSHLTFVEISYIYRSFVLKEGNELTPLESRPIAFVRIRRSPSGIQRTSNEAVGHLLYVV